MDRLALLAIVISACGLLLTVSGSLRLGRAVRARASTGAPYRPGTIHDRFTGLLLRLPVLLVGLALGGLAVCQSAFQSTAEMARIGRLESRKAGWGRTAVTFRPDPLYIDDRELEGEIAGARWAVAGIFVEWSPSLRWLGLRNGHRIHHLVGTPNTTGTTPESRGETAVLVPLPRAARALVACDPFIPWLDVRTRASRWFPQASGPAMLLYVTAEGYHAETIPGAGAGRSRGSGS